MVHSPEILRVERVSLERDGLRVVDDVSWTVRSGETWALLGANGSGKTTLLRIVAGYEWPTDGAVEVLGARYGRVDLRELRKSIGWATSSLLTWFPPELPALAHAASGIDASIGLWRPFSPEEMDRARRALRELGGGSIEDRPYGVLSQGERQRVLIARALVARPALLILDEPCAGLDPVAREIFLRDLDGFLDAPEAPTAVFVTHHVEEIPARATHALLLRGGRVLAKGPIAETLTSANLSETFGAECALEGAPGAYRLTVRTVRTSRL